ncbi:hypothetical protein CKAH01_01518 [Colletotrichum kahawae]|uniref:Uncharacterized protein n=1 Tax=Colletotrichum kahawae TaxID=34407 RepID=A0AAD9Y7T9_COLKA|nr:hypothetical protein CKAH01_01518 [Colletotrichum kahawae]
MLRRDRQLVSRYTKPRNRDGPDAGQTRQCSLYSYSTRRRILAIIINPAPRPCPSPTPDPVSIVPVPTVQSFCVPSFTALGQAWHFDATSSRQPAHRYMLDDDDNLGSSCMHCSASAVQYSNVSLEPGVLLVTVTA